MNEWKITLKFIQLSTVFYQFISIKFKLYKNANIAYFV